MLGWKEKSSTIKTSNITQEEVSKCTGEKKTCKGTEMGSDNTDKTVHSKTTKKCYQQIGREWAKIWQQPDVREAKQFWSKTWERKDPNRKTEWTKNIEKESQGLEEKLKLK